MGHLASCRLTLPPSSRAYPAQRCPQLSLCPCARQDLIPVHRIPSPLQRVRHHASTRRHRRRAAAGMACQQIYVAAGVQALGCRVTISGARLYEAVRERCLLARSAAPTVRPAQRSISHTAVSGERSESCCLPQRSHWPVGWQRANASLGLESFRKFSRHMHQSKVQKSDRES